MGTPPPLPPVREDPAYLRASEIQRGHAAKLANLRQQLGKTDLELAKAVVGAYNADRNELDQLKADLFARRQARQEWLGRQLPYGPGISSDTSPADRAVLMTVFNQAMERARSNPERDDRQRMLTEAQRFGDELTTRAVLTTAIDEGQPDLLQKWAAGQAPEVRSNVQEWLGRTASGTDGLWMGQAFRPLPVPPEWHDLPILVDRHNAQVQEYNRSRGPAQQGQPLISVIRDRV